MLTWIIHELKRVCCCLVTKSCLAHSSLIPWAVALPGSSVHGIFQSRILGWVLPPKDLPHPRIEPVCPALAGRFFTTEPPGKPKLERAYLPTCSSGKGIIKNHSRSHTCSWSVSLSPWFITSAFRALEELKKSPEFFFILSCFHFVSKF